MARELDRRRTPGGWPQIKSGDVAELRGKRRPARVTVRVATVLPPDVNGLGVVDEAGETYRRWYWDARIIVDPVEPR